MTAKTMKSDAEWRSLLTPLQYNVTRRGGSERAFEGAYLDCRDAGVYRCVCCGADLFASEAKLDSRTGWPCFRASVAPESVKTREDYSWFRRRVEAACAACDAHLGHVVGEGPDRGYCVSSAALELKERT